MFNLQIIIRKNYLTIWKLLNHKTDPNRNIQFEQPKSYQKEPENKNGSLENGSGESCSRSLENSKPLENGLEIPAKELRVPATTDLSTLEGLGMSISDSNNTDNIGRGYLFLKMSCTQRKLQMCVLEVLECILYTYKSTDKYRLEWNQAYFLLWNKFNYCIWLINYE